MKSIASCFKSILTRPLLSKSLIAEDFHRYWLIPAIAWAAYFLSTVFPILMSYHNLDNNMGRYIQSLLQSQNPFVFFFNVLLPLVVAATLYRYMHSVSSAAVVHAMPFNRNTLFNSHLVSGYCMSILPVLVNGMILLLISKPVFWDPQTGNFSVLASPVSDATMIENIFARSDILSWMWQSALIIAVIYAIAAFTASVTGNSIVHLVLSGICIGLAPGFLGMLIAYFDQFLYGYITSESYTSFIMGINPITQAFRNADAHFTAGWLLWYLASILVMYLLGMYLYKTKKLERATESITFRPLAVYMSYIASFFGMTAFGFYLYAMSQGNLLYLYLGFAAGTVIVFLLAELIIAKSWNIFHKKTFVKLGAYFLIAAAFLLCLNFDATGYERRIPAAPDVSSVYFYEPASSTVLYDSYSWSSDRANRMELRTEENINAVRRMHEAMVARRNLSSDPAGSGLYAQTSLSFDYSLKNSSFLTRWYGGLSMREFVIDNTDLKTIMESEEYKSQILLHSFYPKGGQVPEGSRVANDAFKKYDSRIGQGQFDKIDITGHGSLNVTLSDLNDLTAFHDCIKADLMARSFEEMLMPYAPLINVNYRMTNLDNKGMSYSYIDSASYDIGPGSYSVSIDGSFKHTINWLQEKGHYDGLILDPAAVRYITIDKIIFDENGYPIQTGDPLRDQDLKMQEIYRSGMPVPAALEYSSSISQVISETPPEPTATKMVITDSAQIRRIMDTYNHSNGGGISPLSTYTVRIFVSFPDPIAEKGESMGLYSGCYYDMTIPAEFATYFK